MFNGPIEDASEEYWYINSYNEYDVDGNLLVEIEYLESGELENKVTYKYNKKGRVVEQYNYSTIDEITEKFIYERDDSDNIIEVTIEYLDGSKSFKKYERSPTENTEIITIVGEEGEFEGKEFRKFNVNQDKLEEVIYNEDGKIEQKFVFEYDEEFNLINQKDYGEDGEFLYEIKNKYNEKGKLVEEHRFDHNNEILRRSVYTYNEEGGIQEIQLVDAAYYPQGYILKFEENKTERTTKEERFFVNGELDFKLVSRYDENNLIIENTKFSQERIGSDYRIQGDKFYTSTRYKYTFY